MFNKITSFTNNPRIKHLFLLSPFIICFIGFIITIILGRLNYPLKENVILLPIVIGIGYFILWFLWIIISIIFNAKYVPYNPMTIKNLLNESKKNNWKILNEAKQMNGEISFKVTGIENNCEFTFERERPISEEIFFNTAIYIRSNKRENYEITSTDLDKGDVGKKSSKNILITKMRTDLNWLIKTNNFISKISFHNGSMGALIEDEVNIHTHLKEVIIKLIEITKVYNQL